MNATIRSTRASQQENYENWCLCSQQYRIYCLLLQPYLLWFDQDAILTLLLITFKLRVIAVFKFIKILQLNYGRLRILVFKYRVSLEVGFILRVRVLFIVLKSTTFIEHGFLKVRQVIYPWFVFHIVLFVISHTLIIIPLHLWLTFKTSPTPKLSFIQVLPSCV